MKILKNMFALPLMFYIIANALINNASADSISKDADKSFSQSGDILLFERVSQLNSQEMAISASDILSRHTWEEWGGERYRYSDNYKYHEYYNEKVSLFKSWKENKNFEWIDKVEFRKDLGDLPKDLKKCEYFSNENGSVKISNRDIISPDAPESFLYKISAEKVENELYGDNDFYVVFRLNSPMDSTVNMPQKRKSIKVGQGGFSSGLYILFPSKCSYVTRFGMISNSYFGGYTDKSLDRLYGVGIYNKSLTYFSISSNVEDGTYVASLRFYYPYNSEKSEEGISLRSPQNKK